MEEGVLEGFIRYGKDNLEDGVIGFLHGNGDNQEVGYYGNDLIKVSPSLGDVGRRFYSIYSY